MSQGVVRLGLNLCCYLPWRPGLLGSILSRGICEWRTPSGSSRHMNFEDMPPSTQTRKAEKGMCFQSRKRVRGGPGTHHLVTYVRRGLLLVPQRYHVGKGHPCNWLLPLDSHCAQVSSCSWGLREHVLMWNNPGLLTRKDSPPAHPPAPSEGLNCLVTGNKKDTNSDDYNNSKSCWRKAYFSKPFIYRNSILTITSRGAYYYRRPLLEGKWKHQMFPLLTQCHCLWFVESGFERRQSWTWKTRSALSSPGKTALNIREFCASNEQGHWTWRQKSFA